MRLTSEQLTTIRTVAAACFGVSARLWLFGSRTKDDLRGGDIDVYVETELDAKAALAARLRFETALFRKLDDRKIDVVIRCTDRPTTAFEAWARAEGIAL